jgi:hypothetical protein
VNHFSQLAQIDVKPFLEKKQNLTYMSWPHAVNALMEHDAAANWTFHEPVMYGETMMVSCTVTAFGKPITMHLPVMDHRNQAVKNPDAVIVNKNMMRCLVKAIACHGLGLSVYAGEDLPSFPDPETGEVPPPPAPKAAPKADPKPEPKPLPNDKLGGDMEPWQVNIKLDVKDDLPAWIDAMMAAFRMQLEITSSTKDVMALWRVNKQKLDTLKEQAPDDYEALLADFSKRKALYKETK